MTAPFRWAAICTAMAYVCAALLALGTLTPWAAETMFVGAMIGSGLAYFVEVLS